MQPTMGWTMLSRDEIRLAELALSNSEQDTRDEIGFLLLHQGFADRFFPGTSVLQTRVRYILFIPWLFQQAATSQRRGRDMEGKIRDLMIDLARRLKVLGGEDRDVIGGDKIGQLTSQPPDRVYWGALNLWNILLPEINSRAEAIGRLRSSEAESAKDDEGGRLEDGSNHVFVGLPPEPAHWSLRDSPLNFKMPFGERDYIRRKLSKLQRQDGNSTLLACLAESRKSVVDRLSILPLEIDIHADPEDRVALSIARDAAALSAIGRCVYGALVEKMIADDGGVDSRNFRQLLKNHFDNFGSAAAHCDLAAVKRLIPTIPDYVMDVFQDTKTFVNAQHPEDFFHLLKTYKVSEVARKGQRARLDDTPRAAVRRREWQPDRHNTSPLHYRWKVVRQLLTDLSEPQ